MASKAKPLREEVKRRFYKLVEQRGFVREKAQSPYFTTFRRVSDNKTDLIDILWDKNWRPYFVVNFGQGEAAQKDIQISGRLQRRRGAWLRWWFNSKRPWLQKLSTGKWHYTLAEVVDELESAFEELETWWQTREEGPHINIFR